MPDVDAAPIPEIRKQLTRWNRSARTLRIISVLLGFTAIAASVLVASGLLSDGVMRAFAEERKAVADLVDAYERAEASIGDITVKT